jgi:predicted Zn-dependent peptidase
MLYHSRSIFNEGRKLNFHFLLCYFKKMRRPAKNGPRLKMLLWAWVSLFPFAGLGASAAQDEPGLPFSWSRFTLQNGLEVVLSEDEALPLVSVVLAYQAGSIYEQPGKTGLAFLLENMMFMGSLNVGPMQHLGYISRVGGEPNASTTEDITYFYQTVPANQLALVLWLESDRMKTLEIDAAKVERAKQSLIDQISQRRAAEPYLDSQLVFDRLLYPDFAHGHGVLGREEDITGLEVADVRAFYAAHYVPNNAALVIVGNIDLARTRELVEKYFETIAPGRKPPLFLPPRPPDKREVIQSFEDSLIPSSAFHLGYRIAPPYSRDYYVLAVLDYFLFKGKSARLYRKLVKKEGLALYITGDVEKRKDMAAIKIFAMNNNETMVELCQKAVISEFNKLRTSDVSPEELAKAKSLFKRDYLGRLASPMERAMFLAEMVFSPVGLDGLPDQLSKYMRISPYEIRQAVSRYLVPEGSVILNVKLK